MAGMADTFHAKYCKFILLIGTFPFRQTDLLSPFSPSYSYLLLFPSSIPFLLPSLSFHISLLFFSPALSLFSSFHFPSHPLLYSYTSFPLPYLSLFSSYPLFLPFSLPTCLPSFSFFISIFILTLSHIESLSFFPTLPLSLLISLSTHHFSTLSLSLPLSSASFSF